MRGFCVGQVAHTNRITYLSQFSQLYNKMKRKRDRQTFMVLAYGGILPFHSVGGVAGSTAGPLLRGSTKNFFLAYSLLHHRSDPAKSDRGGLTLYLPALLLCRCLCLCRRLPLLPLVIQRKIR